MDEEFCLIQKQYVDFCQAKIFHLEQLLGDFAQPPADSIPEWLGKITDTERKAVAAAFQLYCKENALSNLELAQLALRNA